MHQTRRTRRRLGLAAVRRCLALGITVVLGVAFVSHWFAPAASAFAPPTIRVSEGLSTSEEYPSIAFGNEGQVYAGYSRTETSDIMVRADQDGWLADGIPIFTTSINANDNAGSALAGGPNVAMAVDGNGSLYVAWQDLRDFFGPRGVDVRIARSDDHGSSFTGSIAVSDYASSNIEGLPAIAVGPSGTVYAVWAEDRGSIYFDISFSKSSDQGQTWSPAVRINDVTGVTHHTYPRIGVDAQERIFVTWLDDETDDRVLLDRSTDGGGTWVADIEVGPGAGNNYLPGIAVDANDVIHLAWFSDRAGDGGLYYSRSLDHGLSWSPNIRANEFGYTAEYVPPRIAFRADGSVTIAWTRIVGGARWLTISQAMTTEFNWAQIWALSGIGGLMTAVDPTGNLFMIWSRDDGGSAGREVYMTWMDEPPLRPGGFRAVATGSTITLTWTANAEPDLGGYLVSRSVDVDQFERLATLPATATTFADPGRAVGPWTYRIDAFDRQGNFGPPAFAAATVEPATDDRIGSLQAEIARLREENRNLENEIAMLRDENRNQETNVSRATEAIGDLQGRLVAAQNLTVVLLVVVIGVAVVSAALGWRRRREGATSAPLGKTPPPSTE